MGAALAALATLLAVALLLARRRPGELSREGNTGLSDDQRRILAALAAACAGGDRLVVYRTEWAGFLPNPLSQWVEVGGRPAWHGFPVGRSEADLEALAGAGALRKVREERKDEYDATTVYELVKDDVG